MAGPVRVSATRSEMDIIRVGTTDIATPSKAREAFIEQLTRELPQARAKLRKYDLNRGAVLLTTYNSNATEEVPTAFRELDPRLYADCAGVFWFNSHRPFTVKALFERDTLFTS